MNNIYSVGSRKIFEGFERDKTVEQKSNLGVTTHRWWNIFARLFGLTVKVNIDNKIYHVNKKSLTQFIERNIGFFKNIIPEGQSPSTLKPDQLKKCVQDLAQHVKMQSTKSTSKFAASQLQKKRFPEKELTEVRTPDTRKSISSTKEAETKKKVTEPIISEAIPQPAEPLEPPSQEIRALSERFANLMKNFGDFTYEEVRECKHELKEKLASPNLSNSDKKAMLDLKKNYDAFVEADMILRGMKRMGHILKKEEEMRTPEETKLLQTFYRFLEGAPEEDQKLKRVWVKTRIWEAHKESHILQNRNITWIHGSHSAALPIMKRYQQARGEQAPALVPTGVLLKHNFVPLTGELGGGIHSTHGVNREALSGMRLGGLDVAESYAMGVGVWGKKGDSPLFIFNASKEEARITDYTTCSVKTLSMRSLSHLKVAVLRLLLMADEKTDRQQLRAQIHVIKEKILNSKGTPQEGWSDYGGYIGKYPKDVRHRPIESGETLHAGQLVLINSSYGNQYGIVSRYDDETKTYEIIKEKQMSTNSSGYYKSSDLSIPTGPLEPIPIQGTFEGMEILEKEIADIETLFDTVQPLALSEKEKDLIGIRFPIVWASCTLIPEYASGMSAVAGEFRVKQSAQLGRDIQLAITDKEHLETLRQQVAPFGVQVITFEAAALQNVSYYLKYYDDKK